MNIKQAKEQIKNAMTAYFEEYYEAAGFAKIHERVLKDMTDDEIRQLYRETYKTEPEDPVNHVTVS